MNDDLDMSNIYNQWGLNDPSLNQQPTDATNAVNPNIPVTNGNSGFVSNKVSSVTLTKGSYRLTIGNPTGNINNFKPLHDMITVIDASGAMIQKRYTVDAIKYDVVKDKVICDITIIDNPIPVLILWGAVFAVCAVFAAFSAKSILESVEKLPVELSKSPLTWAIVAIFLIPVLIVAFKGKSSSA